MSLKDLEKKLNEFKKHFQKKDYEACSSELTQLKIMLTGFPSLPPTLQKSKHQQKELQVAREILEVGVLLSVAQEDEEGFERNMQQLKPYYRDIGALVQSSQEEHHLMSLYLMLLLVQNRIAEFHTELEAMSSQAINSEHIKYAKQLERWLLEGAYSAILSDQSASPSPYYKYFETQLEETVRNEIAACCEVAYKQLRIQDAVNLMKLSGPAELEKYAKEREWQVKSDVLHFAAVKQQQQDDKPTLAAETIYNTMMYAREIERII